tara:strand:- start:136 stop:318 length:183 start_codon:yes stop_codon:yes gene_type:complete
VTKYRVIQLAHEKFIIEERIFFIWWQIMVVFTTLDNAKKHIEKISYVKKVVYETGKEQDK